MSYEEFVQEIVRLLRGRTGDGVQASVYSSLKNNGFRRVGIRFSEEGSRVSPTIYLEEFYDRYRAGAEAGELSGELLKLYRRIRPDPAWEGEKVQRYEEIKDRIVYKLVNRGQNEELLKQTPYMPYLDLAVLFCVLMEADPASGRVTTMLIQYEQLSWWDVSAEAVYRQAAKNTERLLPCECSALGLLIEELLQLQGEAAEKAEELSGEESMYVMTNRMRSFGASAVLYPGCLEAMADYFQENFFVLPSSIHEMILIPESRAASKERLDAIVREVNAGMVSREDFLSDHTYYYDRIRKKLLP